MEITPEQLLSKIGEILESLRIPYAIIGGFAVIVWGKPRFTADIDIIVELVPKNIPPLAKALLKIDKNVYVSEEAMRDALQRKGEFNFIHPQTGLKVDFWIVKDKFNKEEIKRGIPRKIENQKVNFVSPEDLILSKLLWYKSSESTRQLEDVKSVLKISKVDLNYIKNWAEKQSTIKILKSLIENET